MTQPSNVRLVTESALATDLGPYLTQANASSTYLTTATAASTYATQTSVSPLLNPPRCQLVQDTAQSIPANTRTALTWDTELTDTSGMHSTTTNPSRVTIATPGLYFLSFSVVFPSTTAYTYAWLMLNGGYMQGGSDTRLANTTQDCILRACRDVYLNAGDYVEVHAQTSVAQSTLGSSLSDGTLFQVRYVAAS